MSADDATLRSLLSDTITGLDPALHDRLLVDPTAYLDLVTLTARARTETDTLLRLAVAGARAAGCTWEAIGGVLGMTRQAAQQRYGAPDADGTPGPAGASGSAGAPGTADTAPDDRAGAASGRPEHRVHQIGYLNSFTEMKALENASHYGWHLLGTGSGTIIVGKSDVQWAHQRVFGSRLSRRALADDGWEQVGTSWFPWAYFKRPTTVPALPEPANDGYLGRS